MNFDAREICGHTLKSSLIHKISFDTRDDRVMPTTGIKASLVQELAGLSPIGTTAFFKTMCSIDISKRYAIFNLTALILNAIINLSCYILTSVFSFYF